MSALESEYEPATAPGRCPKCVQPATTDRHYPFGYGNYPEPINRYYCAACDLEWWV